MHSRNRKEMFKTGHAACVYHSIVKDVDEMRERLISVWCELDQSVVNRDIDEWRRRLSACVDAEGGHIEHYL